MRQHTTKTLKQSAAMSGIPETMTKHAVCTTLNCSMQTVDRMIASGDLRAYRIGKRMVRVSADDVRALFAKPTNHRVID